MHKTFLSCLLQMCVKICLTSGKHSTAFCNPEKQKINSIQTNTAFNHCMFRRLRYSSGFQPFSCSDPFCNPI